jgi:integrase
MARRATGAVIEKQRAGGTVFALRFSAYGERRYVTLGDSSEGWDRARAETELANVLADVRRGIWPPPDPAPVAQAPVEEPRFHEFASEWLAARRSDGLAPRTLDDLEWALTLHLVPYFAGFKLSEITVAEVDRYRRAKFAESERRREAIAAGQPLRDGDGRVLRPLGASAINKTLRHLAAVLDQAEEYGHVEKNAAKRRRRRLKVNRPRPVHLDGVDQMQAVLDAARELDAASDRRTSGRLAMTATLMLAGVRASEAGAMLVRDLDLGRGRLEVGRSKTDAGIRSIDVLPLLRDILSDYKAQHRGGLDDPLFTTANGTPRDKNNIARRVLRPVVEHADELLAQRGQHPLPRGVTPHKFRHTYASLCVALGQNPADVMAQLGHTDSSFTMRVYTHALRLSDVERARLRAFVEGEDMELLDPHLTPDLNPGS